MNLLIDTHILLWWLADDPLLSMKAKKSIASIRNTIYISSVSAWEISIKKSLGKLIAPDNLESAILSNDFETLVITFSHALTAGSLPRHHDDPFDRMLIAQAKIEEFTIVTHDKRFNDYGIPLMLV